MNQKTLRKVYKFEGKGIHTGTYAHVTVNPAPENTGLRFVRTDLGVGIPALAENVCNTARCTTIGKDGATVSTVEHLISALTGLGVDNAEIEIDNIEVPILDGSASYFVRDILADGLQEQQAERIYIEIDSELTATNDHGSLIKITPADEFSYELVADFGSKVLGEQKSEWNPGIDYVSQIAPCRTFCFFHELEYLVGHGLVKGGDMDNAIVVVEHPASDEQISRLAAFFGIDGIKVNENGYLNNLELHFPNECGRHKMLDLIGDLRLAGGFLRAHVSAYKPGHTVNTEAAKVIRKHLK